MFAPPTKKNRCLFTVWTQPTKEQRLQVWSGPETFAAFFPISEEKAAQFVGESGWHYLTSEEALQFSASVRALMASIHGPDSEVTA
jgi:hypothetical protein